MIGDTLTTENLLAIFEAMSKIKPIDRSQCFDNYYDEIIERLIWKELDRITIEKRNQGTREPGNQQKIKT
jgi:hypothetical protein